jgi:hypothetical protein
MDAFSVPLRHVGFHLLDLDLNLLLLCCLGFRKGHSQNSILIGSTDFVTLDLPRKSNGTDKGSITPFAE